MRQVADKILQATPTAQSAPDGRNYDLRCAGDRGQSIALLFFRHFDNAAADQVLDRLNQTGGPADDRRIHMGCLA
jgi:hypothetical protein